MKKQKKNPLEPEKFPQPLLKPERVLKPLKPKGIRKPFEYLVE